MTIRALARPHRRRAFLALSGAGLAAGAGGALSACGSDEEEPSAERDVELLNAALAAESNLASAYENARGQELESDADDAVAAFAQRAGGQVRRLRTAISDAGGTQTEAATSPPEGESALEAVAAAASAAVTAYRSAVGRLSTPELRRTVLELMAADAAQLAVVRGLLGEEQVPHAFVTGLDEPPLQQEREAEESAEPTDEGRAKEQGT